VQIKTRIAGVLATSAAAIAIMGGPAFASNNPVVGNIVGNGNISVLSGNNVQIPVQIPVDICGTPWPPGLGQRQLPGWRRGLPGQPQQLKLTGVVKGAGSRGTRRPLP
jgi:small secreted domain DUF320